MGGPSSVPLFRLTKRGKGDRKFLSYDFLPSRRPVPLPDPDRYGFKPEKLAFMRRHVFKFKAIVMETQSNVTISPTFSQKLFIPDERAKYGYYMTSKPQTINPGGPKATGGFTEWWTLWFGTRAQGIVTEQVKMAEEFIKSTGQRVIRDATTGRFASGKAVEFGYVDAAERTAQIATMTAAKNYFNEGDEDW